MIQIDNLTYSQHRKTLVNNAALSIAPAHKVGIVGRNGCGKSTLLAILMGKHAPDSGDIFIPKLWQLAMMQQHIENLEQSVFEHVLSGHQDFYSCYQQLKMYEAQDDWEKVAEIHQTIDHHRWYDQESKAASICEGLGFSFEKQHQPLKDCSGGWRVRAALARALFAPSDVLILDEPTNHLDVSALDWLETFLKNCSKTLLMISHDAWLLDSVCSHTLVFDQGQLRYMTGGYSQAMAVLSEKMALQNKLADKQAKKVEHLMSFVNRFRAKATKAKQAQSRLKQIEKMTVIAKVQAQSNITFEFESAGPIPTPVIQMKSATLGYGDHPILTQVNLYLGNQDRIALVGNNGEGKSTLAKSLIGELPLLSGEYQKNKAIKIGYFAQHQLEQLPESKTPLQHWREQVPSWTVQNVRNFLGRFAFDDALVNQPIHTLSGGEKARLVLAALVHAKPHMLVLDEPTNHCDLQMREALSLALQTFEGPCVLISHDRQFLENNVTQYYLVKQGRVSQHDTFDETLEALKATNKPEQKSVSIKEDAPKKQRSAQQAHRACQTIEKSMHQVQTKIDALDHRMKTTPYEDSDRAQWQRWTKQINDLKATLDDLETQWIECQDA